EDRPTTAEVAIVNRALARRLFGPNQDPVGHRVGFGKAPKDAAYLVVGEIADVLVDDLRRAPPPMIYLPVAQHFPTRGVSRFARSTELRTQLLACERLFEQSTGSCQYRRSPRWMKPTHTPSKHNICWQDLLR